MYVNQKIQQAGFHVVFSDPAGNHPTDGVAHNPENRNPFSGVMRRFKVLEAEMRQTKRPSEEGLRPLTNPSIFRRVLFLRIGFFWR
jgi:hypothetical protein